jgi:hypothetical protein
MKKRWIPMVNFIALAVILSSTVLLFWGNRGNTSMQILIGILLSLLYVTWGIIHHAMKGDLHPKVVVEYLLVGAIAITLIITVVWM